MKEGVDPGPAAGSGLPSAMVGDEAVKPAAGRRLVKRCDHLQLAKYYKMMSGGSPLEAVQQKMVTDGLSPSLIERDGEEMIPLGESEADQAVTGPPAIAMVRRCDHPKYSAYFKMRRLGITVEAVRHWLVKEGLDPATVDLDGEDLIPLEGPEMVKRCDHPKYAIYYEMRKAGLPRRLVQDCLVKQGLDPAILDDDGDAIISLDEAKPVVEMVKRRDHPKYAIYFKMLKVGLPIGAVKHCLVKHGLDPTLIELGGDEMVPCGTRWELEERPASVKRRHHPKYAIYYEMREAGLPLGLVRDCLAKQGLDPNLIEIDPKGERMISLEEPKPREPAVEMVKRRDHPKYATYYKMVELGLPIGAVKTRMVMRGLDPQLVELDGDEAIGVEEPEPQGPVVKMVKRRDHPYYARCYKALKFGASMGAVKNNLLWVGLDPDLIDHDGDERIPLEVVKRREHPKYATYYKMLQSGLPIGAVKDRLVKEGLDSKLIDLDGDEMTPCFEETKLQKPAVEMVKRRHHPEYAIYYKLLKIGLLPIRSRLRSAGLDPDTIALIDGDDMVPLEVVKRCEHPKYAMYYKMLKNGVSPGAVKGYLVEWGEDPELVDRDGEEMIPLEESPLMKRRDHPMYSIYYKMIELGLPIGAVKNRLVMGGQTPNLIELDGDEMIPLDEPKWVKRRKHPKYATYYNMLMTGLPIEAVKSRLMNEGLDPGAVDLDGEEVIPAGDSRMVKRRDHPKYAIYYKMLKGGLTPGAIKNRMVKDGVDPSLLYRGEDDAIPLDEELEPQGEYGFHFKLQMGPVGKMVKRCEHPKYATYYKMLKTGLPIGAVKNRMVKDGVDFNLIDLDGDGMIPLKEVRPQGLTSPSRAGKPQEPLMKMVKRCEHPKYATYYKMLQSGLPMGAVINRLVQGGLDPNLIDPDGDEATPLEMVKRCDHPKYATYYKMLRTGLPVGAVKNRLVKDGLDPAMIDVDGEEMIVVEKPGMVKRRDHPKYATYYKMVEAGLPMSVVQARLLKDGLGLNLIGRGDEIIPLKTPPVVYKDHELYSKYFKMKAMGLGVAKIKYALVRDGLSESIIENDPDAIVGAEGPWGEGSPAKMVSFPFWPKMVKRCDHPKYAIYYNMLMAGLPPGAVRDRMGRDGVHPELIELHPEEMVPFFEETKVVKRRDHPQYATYCKMLQTGFPLGIDLDGEGMIRIELVKRRHHPNFAVYYKMLEIGVPIGAVKDNLVKQGLDPKLIDLDGDEMTPFFEETKMVKRCEHPKYVTYYKMLRTGLPIGAIKNRLTRDGLDPRLIDLNGEQVVPLKPWSPVAYKNHEQYGKYFQMKAMGLETAKIKPALVRDGLSESIIENDPDAIVQAIRWGKPPAEESLPQALPGERQRQGPAPPTTTAARGQACILI